MKELERKINNISQKIDPPERDFMGIDIIKSLFKIIIILTFSLILSFLSFSIFAMIQNYQHDQTIQKINGQFNEFLNNFEILGNAYNQDGNGNNIIGNENNLNGAKRSDD